MSFRYAVWVAQRLTFLSWLLTLITIPPIDASQPNIPHQNTTSSGREIISLNSDWKFWHSTTQDPDHLVYDNRPDTINRTDVEVLKAWILPTANDFINDPANHYERPTGNLVHNISFTQKEFNDGAWESVTLPHDWAIKGPFYTDPSTPVVGGGMGRLPVHGIAWYRRKVSITGNDIGRSTFLDIEGAQSYAMVWLNGNLVGGWPYPYNSFRLDLTPYLVVGENQLAIRLDNPNDSSRWYPGGGLYRDVWLTKVESTHVAQWGTYITSRDISTDSAALDLVIQIENTGTTSSQIEVLTSIYEFNATTGVQGKKVADFPQSAINLPGGQKQSMNASVTISSPKLWGPAPTQEPNLYVAITSLSLPNSTITIDTYKTQFGIRSISYTSSGLLVNDELIPLQGVNQHQDLGALGAAFSPSAATRQLFLLRSMGVTAIRLAHNPPSPSLLALTDALGFLIIDEIFDCWYLGKTTNDFHLIFPTWHEADIRSFIRRDRNHPSVVIWSFGNEVGEQTTANGTAIAESLHAIVNEEDATRFTMASMNVAKPNTTFPSAVDIKSLNYQGEGIRDLPAYLNLTGTRTTPLYPAFHAAFPSSLIFESESSSALSTRGTFLFPVTSFNSSPISDTILGSGNSTLQHVSSYELYSADFGSSPDISFASLDANPYVGGEFVWSGFDYLGEPTPYYTARSSYSGIIDLAGFPKDRFYLYQARWRPDLKMAHILPHWNWPGREGEVTPVHVFSSGDEAELWVNGVSQGKVTRGELEYRFRWDTVIYQPGEVTVQTWKQGAEWANATIRTTFSASHLQLTPDRDTITADGIDLSYVTLKILDSRDDVVPDASNKVTFEVSGDGELVATDNGDPADFTAFQSAERNALNGFAVAIVKAKEGGEGKGKITVTAKAEGLEDAVVILKSQ